MIIDNDTQKFIELMLANKVPKIDSLTPKELRDMRAKMSSIPPEQLVKIKNIKDITFNLKNKKITLRVYKDTEETQICNGRP